MKRDNNGGEENEKETWRKKERAVLEVSRERERRFGF